MKDRYLYGIRYRGNFGYGLWQQAVASKAALDASNYETARLHNEDIQAGRRIAYWHYSDALNS